MSAGDLRELPGVPLRGEGLSVCPGPNFPLQGRQGSRGCIPGSPGESGLVLCGGMDGDLTSLAPHERLPEILVVPRAVEGLIRG